MKNNHQPMPLILEDSVFVIFGVTGDLAKRKLLPALYELAGMDLLPENFTILGLTRRETSIEKILDDVQEILKDSGKRIDATILDKLASMIELVYMDIGVEADYGKLKVAIQQADKKAGRIQNRLFYLAIPPQMFEGIVEKLQAHGLDSCGEGNKAESRLLIEKPFGHNTETAVSLIKKMEKVFDEKSIYRVDHYLAKETTQNILTFRFNNPMFKAVWDNRTIDHIMITASEKIKIEGRAEFYESTGALRDLIQSHLLQLLALVTMEEPADKSAESIHEAKLRVLEAVKPITSAQVDRATVRGQYDSYKEEVANRSSTTETFAAIKLEIDNPRWNGVPILLRTGKAMKEKITEITLVFKEQTVKHKDINALTIRIQPDEGIVLSFLAKKPSLSNETEMVHMKFFYHQTFNVQQPDAYERVLVDAIRGDKTLFTTDAEVLVSWKIIENVLSAWAKNDNGLNIYPTGSWGPNETDKLAESVGGRWLTAYMPHVHQNS